MRQVPTFAIVLLILSVFSFPIFLNQIVPPANAASASFSFAASGDMGSLTVSTSISNLNRLVTDSPNFFLGLGDFSYDPSVTGNTWCGQFKSSFNSIQILLATTTLGDTIRLISGRRTVMRDMSTAVPSAPVSLWSVGQWPVIVMGRNTISIILQRVRLRVSSSHRQKFTT